MSALHAGVVRASFLFICDLSGHRREWLGSTTRTSTLQWYLVVVIGY